MLAMMKMSTTEGRATVVGEGVYKAPRLLTLSLSLSLFPSSLHTVPLLEGGWKLKSPGKRAGVLGRRVFTD